MEFLSTLTFKEYAIITTLIVIILLVVFKKFFSKIYNKFLLKCEKFIKPIVDEAVIKSAEYLNSKTGQEKMDLAVKYVQEHTKNSPWFIKIFLTNFNKAWLVNIIEKAYQTYKFVLDSQISDESIDIKGNEVKKN